MDPKSILRIVQDYEPTSIALRLAAQGLIPTPKHTHSAQDLPIKSIKSIKSIKPIGQTIKLRPASSVDAPYLIP